MTACERESTDLSQVNRDKLLFTARLDDLWHQKQREEVEGQK